MMPRKWTDQQQDAIETVDRSTIVSAAAGSGKTAVLAERCARIVVEPEIACDVDRLLVVTFTNDAAEEMRSRIERTLRARLEANPADERLEKQLFLLQRAQISTIHGFCNRIIQQHFHLLGLDPGMRLLQEEEASLMRTQLLRDLIHRRYGQAKPEAFENLLEWYFDGNDERLLGVVLKLHHLLTSVIDPAAWAKHSRERIRDAISGFEESDLAKALAELIASELQATIDAADEFAAQYAEPPGLAGYIVAAREVKSEALRRLALAKKADFDSLATACKTYSPATLKSARGVDASIREPAKKALDLVRNGLKGSRLAELCQYSTQEWIDGIATTRASVVQLLALTRRLARDYQRAKRALRALDFSDLEHYALQILSEHPDVSQQYREHFCHVLVDEYQDINDVQQRILTLVSREEISEPELPANLFTVGDVKQSIYRFRLADPTLFLRRYSTFHKTPSPRRKAIDLQANFRSRGPLLEAINFVFERLMSRATAEVDYDESQKLIPHAEYPFNASCHFAGTPVELHLLEKPPRGGDDDTGDDALDDLDRTEREAVFVANRIRELLSRNPPVEVCEKRDDKLNSRPLAYKDIVILLRSRKVKAQQFSEQLQRAGIPVHAETGSGFFETLEIRDVLALLQLLDNQQQDIPMAAVLRSPFVKLDWKEDALAAIRLRYRALESLPFHQAVMRYASDADDRLAGDLRRFFKQFDRWRDLAHRKPLAEVIAMIYSESGYLTWCSGLPNGRQRVANLLDLLERARQFGSFQRQGLNRFLEFLRKLEEESDLGEPSLLGEGEDAVRILTVHGSKGLEFPVVFVADLGKGHNFQDEKSSILAERELGLALDAVDARKRIRYSSAGSVVMLDRLHNSAIAEELRVLYVAMTRAREHLILVGTADFTQVERWRERWTGRQGRLPVRDVQRGKTFLDWLVPCTFAINSFHPGTIDLQLHDLAQISTFAGQFTRPQKESIDPQLRDFKALSAAPKQTALSAQVINTISTTYPHVRLTRIPATQAVTTLAKQTFDDPVLTARQRAIQRPLSPLMPPRFVLGMDPISPADTGTATHLVLQHLDFTRASDLVQVKQQVNRLVECRLILPAYAELVDCEAIVWLMSTNVGALLQKHHDQLHRELPVYFSQPSPGMSGLDQPMVRGRIDVLIPLGKELALVDYKTDRVTSDTLPERAKTYQPQLLLYGNALEAISGQPVKLRYLAFLSARQICQV
jgi:ATP-dependent helicase/nuclease subunit A